jgi:tRNA dimethylallyltransferase
MPAPTPKSALLIAGPTASGKSALALRLARERGGVIINADSMQVYRELRLLSARPSAEEEAQAPHRLYGQVSGAEDYSVARWLTEATREIEAVWAEGQVPIICGGTGLYFMALETGLSQVPPIAPEVRERWRGFAGDLHAELAARDPAMAERLGPTDRQRIIRALEVIDSTGQSLARWQAEGERNAFLNQINVERHFVEVPREELYTRAEQRFDLMMAAGALDEVEALPAFAPDRPVMKAIGVPELQAHLRGEMSLEQAATLAKTATRQYIKRQMTWWRGQMKGWHRARVVG